MLINWDGSLSVGNKQIDRDHETLVGIINKLDNAVNNNREADVISDILSELSDYVVYHFYHEEQFMRRHHYPELDEHIPLHSDLIKGLDALVYEFESNPGAVTGKTLDFLKNWLVDHVTGSDMKFGDFLRQKGQSYVISATNVLKGLDG